MKFLLESGGSLGDIQANWQPLGQGGSGRVYKHPKKLRGAVVKLYHITPKDYAAEHEAKAHAMLETPPSHILGGNNVIQLAWPFDLVRDTSGKFRGIVMPEIDITGSLSLSQLMAPRLRQKLNIPESPFYRLMGARNLARVMRNVHKSGHFVIDLKPPNTRIYRPNYKRGPGFIAIMDCDGFAIRGRNGHWFPAGFTTAEYLHPSVSLSSAQGFAQLGREQDLYALAVIIFQLLNNNIHPFQGIDAKGTGYPAELSQRTRVRPPLYAYGLQHNPRVKPVHRSLHHWFAPELRRLFDRAFLGSSNLPDTNEWLAVLDRLCEQQQACPRDKDHWKLGDACGLCAQQGVPQAKSSGGISHPGLFPGARQPNQVSKTPAHKRGVRPPAPPFSNVISPTPAPQGARAQRTPSPRSPLPPGGNPHPNGNVSAPLWAWIFSTATAIVLSYGFAALLPYRLVRIGPSLESLLVEAIGFWGIGYIGFRWLLKRLGRWWTRRHQGCAPSASPKAKLACMGLWVLLHLVVAPATAANGPPAYQGARPPEPAQALTTRPEQAARQPQMLLRQTG